MMKENLDALQKAFEELEDAREDLLRRVVEEEDKGLQRLAQVKRWLERVKTVGSQVNDLLEPRSMFGDCSDDHGKEVLKRLEEVKELQSKGYFVVVANKSPVPKAEEMDIQTVVGLDTKVEMAWNSLMNDGIRTLGLYGMGGVGKTTLLTCINNIFGVVENKFDVVIWVVVSKETPNKSIQEQILERISGDNEWKHETEKEKTSLIKNNLNRKKFVLLLDDIWSKVDLNKIGVPVQTRENGSKIVFTTRSREVCNYMRADEQIKVDCLSPDEAWELFRMIVGEIPLNQGIPTLARRVAEKCCGLPLALNFIGKAMACKEDVHEWHHAINVLKSNCHEFPGMEEILPILKFSYDSLKDSEVQSCFRYCSLFSEDFEIEKEKLIEYWIGEGFIIGNRFEDGGTNKGYDIIGLLVRAHLLIDCEVKTKVKMHDVIRDMALWIESGLVNQQETIFVKSAGKQINWEILRRISLMRTQIEKISWSPNCPNLLTLLLQDNRLEDISVGFFRFMPQLVVLDLSENWLLTGLPEEISNLSSLKYLNLSFTEIKSLPNLEKLKKLIYLNLEASEVFGSLVRIATTLPNLQVLKLFKSNVYVDDILMEELQRLEHLKVLTANIKDVIRGMALWVESDLGTQQETICVKSGAHVYLIPNDINWEIVRRMSLMSTQIEKISCSPNCPNLSTLLLPYNKWVDISIGFFRFMPQLLVLDLSFNWSLTVLPEEISNLGSLQYLNLSYTGIKSLPIGLKKLRKLIYLNLEFTHSLESLVGIATTLPNLQVLKLFYSRVCVDDILMEELQHLEHLKVLTVNIKDAMILERIQGVDRLARSIRGLFLEKISACNPSVIQQPRP